MIGACLSSRLVFITLIMIIAGLCAKEYLAMMQGRGYRFDALFIPRCMMLALLGTINQFKWFFASISAALLILFTAWMAKRELHIVFNAAGLIYIGGLSGLLGALRLDPAGREWCFFILFATWLNDISAYFGGTAFGKCKLAPRISPNKSWEGAAFGIAAGVISGIYFSRWIGFSYAAGIFSGAFLASMAQLGDLVESYLKRCCKVKDSGSAIPGHGGFLDRFDSLLFAGAGGLLLKTLHGLF